MKFSTKTKLTLATAATASLVCVGAWAQNLDVRGFGEFGSLRVKGGASLALTPSWEGVAIGTITPLGKLHVVAEGNFPADDPTGISKPSAVPIVAQGAGTVFGLLNAHGRQVFAINVMNDGGTYENRGTVDFLDKSSGEWRRGLSFSDGAIVGGLMIEPDASPAGARPGSQTGGWYMLAPDRYWMRTYNDRGLFTGAGVIANEAGISSGYGEWSPPPGGALFRGSVAVGTNNPDETVLAQQSQNQPPAMLQVNGPMVAGNGDLYFTDTPHSHTGIGNRQGWAAIENVSHPDPALFIWGRWTGATGNRRVVKLMDYLEVTGTPGKLVVAGAAEVGGGLNVTGSLRVNGELHSTGTIVYRMNAYCDRNEPITLRPTCTSCRLDCHFEPCSTVCDIVWQNTKMGRLVGL